MEWRKDFLDLIFVTLGILLSILYHAFLWYKVKNHPLKTVIGVNSIGRKLWVKGIMKDGEKNGVLAAQTLRNSIMESTLMATTSIILGCGMAAMISSTYSIKRPLNDTALGSQGDFILGIKYLLVLLFSLFSFLCHSLSICCKCEVGSLIATPVKRHDLASMISSDYVCKVLERGFLFNIVGNRAFYGGFPLLFWVIGPLPVFLGSSLLVLVLYSTDFVSSGMVSRNRDLQTREEEQCLE
ncbi:hypothetical protein SUGI_0897090 [Cryptomeria japonica]|uniref:uncharacterized protein LOC131053060 n=1 Tax=Cryptomeria japonica TaxID=3369 RepID=UPI002414B24C|nr:uncharacterized protein LOC131053060 [Cryptomeria japonica]GLJ43214.1 hypothetical protein SUGI_0897090 [Cryptomeria japonica]